MFFSIVNSQMDLEEDSMKVFREGISLAINFWWVIRLKIRRKSLCDYESSPERCVEWLCDTIFSRFIRSKHLPSATIKLQLKFQLISFLSNVPPEDNSILEVCALIFIDSIIIFFFLPSVFAINLYSYFVGV